MKQEDISSNTGEEPTVSYRPVDGLEARSLDNAIAALKEGDENVLYSFMRIAEETVRAGNKRIATNIRDRAISAVSTDQVREQWVQEILAILNDAIDEARKRVRKVTKKQSDKSASKLVEALVGRVHIEAVEQVSKKGKKVLHIRNITRGKLKGVSRGAVFEMDKLPAALQGVVFRKARSVDGEKEAA
jgi:hypothetical protein